MTILIKNAKAPSVLPILFGGFICYELFKSETKEE